MPKNVIYNTNKSFEILEMIVCVCGGCVCKGCVCVCGKFEFKFKIH